MDAVCEAIHYIAHETDLLPVGMGIGPFSLTAKLISDPITPVFLAGEGATADDEEEVALLERLLELSSKSIRLYLAAQTEAGADTLGIGDAAPGQISCDLYEELIPPREQRLVRGLKEAGAKVRMHIRGNITHLLPGLASLELDIIDVCHMVDLRALCEPVGYATC